ncbi:FAM175 family, plant [Sesbania bispinosa]|nr:FAM175 family, plant [Sesbania bispinosa]
MKGDDDGGDERLSRMKQASKDQRELDGCAEGFEVGRLSRLMGSEAKSYTQGLEDLYQKMLVKIENLTSLVEKSSAKVLEQVYGYCLIEYK